MRRRWIVVWAMSMAIAVAGAGVGIVSAVCAITGGDPAELLLGDDGVDTRTIGGDARAFDPFAAIPEVLAFAGPGSRLVSIDVSLVRRDGTQDLKAPYTPKPDTTYELIREVPRPANAPPPGAGGANTGPWFETIRVRAYEPGQRRQVTRVGGGVSRVIQYTNNGLDRAAVGGATSGPIRTVDVPVCRIADLWPAAIDRGTPPNAVARLSYDADGYRFTVSGFQVSLEFGPDCRLKE